MISHNFWVFSIEENTHFMIFIITQILCEINFGDSRSAKSAILSHLEALDFDFHEFTSPDMSKNSSFCTSRIPKIDFT